MRNREAVNRSAATMTDYPHRNAAFINAIREEGSKEDACTFLQKGWNENCALRIEIKMLKKEIDRLTDLRENTNE